MRHKPGKNPRTQSVRVVANNQIRFPQVRVIDQQGETLGVMSSQEAQTKAREAQLDLVLVTDNAKPPVVKIIDLTKFKYQQQQKQAEQRKKSKQLDIKEVWFTPFIGEGDFQTRLKKVIKFLEKKHKVRIGIHFRRGRQITKKDFGYRTFERVIEATSELATVEIAPKMMGKKLIAQLQPTKR